MSNKQLFSFIVCAMVVASFGIVAINYYRGPTQICVYLTLNDEPFEGWVEVMNPSGEYLEDQAQLINGSYTSLKEYQNGRRLYVIAWVDTVYQIGDYLYILGIRVAVTAQIDRQSFELSDGKLWLFPDNTTLFGDDW